MSEKSARLVEARVNQKGRANLEMPAESEGLAGVPSQAQPVPQRQFHLAQT